MSQFRLMTWNVENLFDVGDDDGPKTQAQFAAKIESLRAVIDAQRPHVLTLQEVGSESALAKLQAALEHKLPHRAVAEPDERGIRVAIISRRVLHDPAEIRPFPSGLLPVQVGDDPPGPDGPRMMNQMGRGALQVTVRANNRDVHIITAHLKSKLLTFPDGRFTPRNEDERARYATYALYRRASEATTLRSNPRRAPGAWGPRDGRRAHGRHERRGGCSDDADPQRATWLGDRLSRVRPTRPWRR